MEELLVKLYERLGEAFEDKLPKKEIFYFNGGEKIDVFKTLMFLNKTKKNLNDLMLEGSVSIDELKYLFDRDTIEECFKLKYILRGNLIDNDKIFIGANGMYKLYAIKDYDIHEVLKAYDNNNFKMDELSLKSQEKIWCIFLVLFGADSSENSLNTEGLSTNKLNDYYNFFKTIEQELVGTGFKLGKDISWNKGKDVTFRRFITNNVDLPKTPIYFKNGTYKYYLDLSKRKNAKYLLDLLLKDYKNEDRLTANNILYNALIDLSFKISTDLGEIPGTINKFVIEELVN